MSRPTVTFRTPDDGLATLSPGDILGRMWGAALRLDHPRVSEAHAMVSLRGDTLQLLRLRGGLWVDDRQLTEVELAPGMRVRLTQELSLDVVDVDLPEDVLVLQVDGGPEVPLTGSVYALHTADGEAVCARYVAGAGAYLWSTSSGMALALAGQPAALLEPGREWALGPHRYAVHARAAGAVGALATELGGNEPMRIVARYDVVHIHREGRPPVELVGVAARIVSELVAVGGVESCDAVAMEVCGAGNPDPGQLRKRLDKNLWTLRRKLAAARIRPDLVRTTGTGHLELVLYEGDRAVDET